VQSLSANILFRQVSSTPPNPDWCPKNYQLNNKSW